MGTFLIMAARADGVMVAGRIAESTAISIRHGPVGSKMVARRPGKTRGPEFAGLHSLQGQGFALPDKGGDGEISFPGKDFWCSDGQFGGGGIFSAVAFLVRYGEE